MEEFFFKWFVLNRKERYFLWLMEMIEEKYDYACFINGNDLTFNEFLTWYKKNKKSQSIKD